MGHPFVKDNFEMESHAGQKSFVHEEYSFVLYWVAFSQRLRARNAFRPDRQSRIPAPTASRLLDIPQEIARRCRERLGGSTRLHIKSGIAPK